MKSKIALKCLVIVYNDPLMNKIERFWPIVCWTEKPEEVLTEKTKYYSEQKYMFN